MAQTAVDLPDPLETPPLTAAGADDLLSQLAGDEIDRMLSDANVERPAAAAPAALAPKRVPNEKIQPSAAALMPASAEITEGQIAAELDDAFEHLAGADPVKSAAIDAPPLAGTPSATSETRVPVPTFESSIEGSARVADAAPPAAASTAQVADLLAQISADDAKKDVATTVSTTQAPTADATEPLTAAQSASAAVSADAAALARELETSTAERKSLVSGAADAATAITAAMPAVSETAPTAPAEGAAATPVAASAVDGQSPVATETPAKPPSFPVRLLMLINAPLSGSDVVRDVVGKIGIVTTLNAIAVLIYVRFFRH